MHLWLAALLSMASPSGVAASPIKSDEEVILFPALGHVEGDEWVVPIHGWIFEPEEDSWLRAGIVKSLEEVLGVSAKAEALFRDRMMWFLVDDERGKDVDVRIGTRIVRMQRSTANGHFYGEIRLPKGRNRLRLQEALTRKRDRRRFAGRVHLLPFEGLSVISDIDDTIKVTEATDKKETLRNTFLRPFRATPGMSERYQQWRRQGAAFHYLSASPWHLYVPLTNWMHRAGFPDGSLHLRYFRLKDSTALNLLKSPHDFKVKNIEALFARFPARRFLLVGDSGQADPEIFSEMARKHPAQVEGIYIREVHPGEMSEERRAETTRGHSAPLTIL